MTNMPTYRQITQPLARETRPDVATHEDIDWRKVTVAEAIDADRQRSLDTIARLKAVRAARKRTWLTTLAEVFGIRRTRS